ncbi:MAG: NAD(P)-dependent oxidoreductase [SAR202 cluster bacterium]|jgi:uronate dehydrogenase|nr:NAD(P)-dependent oxidoreductase [SAR202 cluster bacterium]MDP6302032.1 NAD(P)-dependent oxidoreductase [SAR202 cluster bacterium]MDP7104782.1 NAD(P)-dependent oxidoreductase [SAR202 cluster bacterium]MDP7226429.1 NAD(P)-dependent oxidoreductase [SAR202 cluster bacterium]MDP7413584.1 NAD(P)-dependent oxidoreductase [SAR202 cluster bacterium]|tara:strand:+ start:2104 stop:2799 length:696 start_codon:yes stop_codon:yes gene_type:complete
MSKILITSASTRLARRLASDLAGDHDVRLTDRSPVPDASDFTRCGLGHDENTNDLVRGADVIIHSGWVDQSDSVSDQLDAAMCRTYNLLQAATDESVPRLIFLSSLALMGGYDENFAVTEKWRPVPTTETANLCYHLGEFVCKEFARERRLEVVCLRLGEFVWDEAPASTSALYPDDATNAVRKSLTADVSEGYAGSISAWNVFHIQSAVPDARFLTATANRQLGYEPASR